MVYANDKHQFDTAETASAKASSKPCIAIMGEFSAGKSTLCNLILGDTVLPTKVTATRLPPVWISHGTDKPILVDKDGDEEEIEIEDLARVRPSDAKYVKIFKEADLLGMCDLIDMPGISDPNMAQLDWSDTLTHADAVIWCTHSTQAWRQSEAAAWSALPDTIKTRSMLLLTRFDKLTNDSDRKRVIHRVEKETAGTFNGIYPISLTDAMAAGDDPALLRASGAEGFARGVVTLLGEIDALSGNSDPAS
jgi:GTPase Era involved in 16S rRNA processing